jgi:hypothetical protein
MKFKTLCLTVLLSAPSILMTAGCAKDKNAEDYKNAQVQRDLAKLESVKGRYSGNLISKKSGGNLGALQITLSATTEVQNTGASKASALPILVANVEFKAQSSMAIVAQNSSYDNTSGHYQADISIPSQIPGAAPSRVSLSAVLRDGKMVGTMEALGFSDYGGTFDLSLDGASLDELAAKNPPSQVTAFSTSNFSGETVFATNGPSGKATSEKRATELILLRAQTTSEQDFLNLLSPVKSVLVTLNYGNGAKLTFQNGILDQRNGSLTGQTSVKRSSANDALSLLIACQSTAEMKAFQCKLSTSGTSGVTAQVNVTAGTTQAPPEKGDNSRTSVRHEYSGIAKADQGRTYRIKMVVIYEARLRLDEILDLLFPVAEKTLKVTMSTEGRDLNVPFPEARWDVLNGTLSATGKMNINTQSYDVTLECTNFDFVSERAHYDFTCNYVSSFNGMALSVRLKR